MLPKFISSGNIYVGYYHWLSFWTIPNPVETAYILGLFPYPKITNIDFDITKYIPSTVVGFNYMPPPWPTVVVGFLSGYLPPILELLAVVLF